MTGIVTSLLLLILIYIVVAFGKLEAALIALLGAVAALELRLIDQDPAFAAIDWNTIFLLIGMMMVVSVIKRTGMFQYLAIRSAKLAKGNPILIIIFLSGATALLSAFLDNVTTVLVVAPVTILIADSLELDAMPFLVCEVLASNIGGTATLIGDPPNIMIGSAANLSFNDFLTNLSPGVIIVFFVFIGWALLVFRSSLHVRPELKSSIMELDEKKSITDIRLARICLIVFALTITGFILHDTLSLKPATIALTSAALIIFLTRTSIEQVFKDVEWQTIFFFIGLFIVVAAVNEQGVFIILSRKLLDITRGDITLMALAVLWVSAFAAAFVGAVPFVATMIPFLQGIIAQSPQNGFILWWALSLGACLGGNGTLTGAAANMVVAGIARQHGMTLSYRSFLKFGFPVMIISLIVATLYVIVRYLH
ncbi:ArsB/NhaD family transporter [candidate division WOR-3 bacterium]|nr:ArsB/NhaD family transporter [candidate division WOR-3 bacterium]